MVHACLLLQAATMGNSTKKRPFIKSKAPISFASTSLSSSKGCQFPDWISMFLYFIVMLDQAASDLCLPISRCLNNITSLLSCIVKAITSVIPEILTGPHILACITYTLIYIVDDKCRFDLLLVWLVLQWRTASQI